MKREKSYVLFLLISVLAVMVLSLTGCAESDAAKIEKINVKLAGISNESSAEDRVAAVENAMKMINDTKISGEAEKKALEDAKSYAERRKNGLVIFINARTAFEKDKNFTDLYDSLMQMDTADNKDDFTLVEQFIKSNADDVTKILTDDNLMLLYSSLNTIGDTSTYKEILGNESGYEKLAEKAPSLKDCLDAANQSTMKEVEKVDQIRAEIAKGIDGFGVGAEEGYNDITDEKDARIQGYSTANESIEIEYGVDKYDAYPVVDITVRTGNEQPFTNAKLIIQGESIDVSDFMYLGNAGAGDLRLRYETEAFGEGSLQNSVIEKIISNGKSAYNVEFTYPDGSSKIYETYNIGQYHKEMDVFKRDFEVIKKIRAFAEMQYNQMIQE